MLPSLPADTGRGKQGGNTTKSRSATPGNPTPCSQLSVLECRAPGASPLPGLAAPRGHRRGWVPTATCKPPPPSPFFSEAEVAVCLPHQQPPSAPRHGPHTQPLGGGGGNKKRCFAGILRAEDGEDALVQTQDEILHPTPLPGAAVCCWRGKSTPLGPQAWCHCAVEALLHLPKETTRSPGRSPTPSVLSTVHSQLQCCLLGGAARSPGRSRRGFSS